VRPVEWTSYDASIPVTITIVLPHREIYGPTGAGAVAMVVRRLAMARSRHSSRVIGPRFDGVAFPDAEFVPVSIPAWLPMTPTQRYALVLARALARLPPGPIEVHNKPDVARWLARLFPQRPVSLFLHNDPRTMRGARSPGARRRLLQCLAGVVTVSDFLCRAMLDGISPAPTRLPLVVHNTLDPAELPQILPARDREQVILFVGRFVPEKAPDAFIAACAWALPRLSGWRAEVIGASGFSPGAADSRFISGLRPAAATAGVALLGPQPHSEVLAAMARAAIVVVPSRWDEPFGMTALEAMACGAALACSGRGGLKEVTGNAALPINPDDAEGFAQAIVQLATDAGLRAGLATAGLQRARVEFSTAGAIERLDAERDRVLVGRRAAGRGPADPT